MNNKLFYALCLIGGVILYFITPHIHYLSTLPKEICIIVIFVIVFALSLIGFYIFYKNPKELKKKSLKWFIPAFVLLISTLSHLIFAQGQYDSINGCIIYRYDESQFGVKDKWGKEIVPKSDFESLFFTGLSGDHLVGVIYNGLTENKVNEIRYIYVYKFEDGHFTPYSLEKIICADSGNSNRDLYSYIKDKVGYPLVDNTDYMQPLHDSYVKSVEEIDINETRPENKKREIKPKAQDDDAQYEVLGDVDVYYYAGERSPDYREGFRLLVKSVNGDNIYYISRGTNKYLVYRSDFEIRGWVFNARAGDHYILVNPAWPLKQSEMDSEEDTESGPSQETTQQPRQLVPVQEWVPCGSCYGTGKCPQCNGTGQNFYNSSNPYEPCLTCGRAGRCVMCAGQGGHYQTFYR